MRDGLACRCGRGTLYDVLQVSPWCEPEVIQAAFRALARSRHPDVNRDPDAEDQMRRLNVAYQTLSDPSRRSRYDEELALEAARPVVAARPTPNPTTGPTAAPPTWATAGGAANGHGHTGSGHTARGASAGPRPSTSGAASSTGAPVSAASASMYQPTIFDTQGEMLFPRSAVYASLIIVTAIVALVAWLVLDTMAQRPNAPIRLPRGYDEMRTGPMASSPWQFEPLGGSVEPGLSR